MKKTFFLIPIGIIAVALLVHFMMTNKKQEIKKENFVESIKYVKVDTVSYDSYQINLNSFGKLKANSKIELYSEVTGVLEKSNKRFKEGVNFKAGEVLFKIDSKELEFSLLSQKSDLLNVLTSIMPDLKIDYPKSFPNWQKYLEKFDVNKKLEELPQPLNNQEKFFISNKNIYKLFYSIQGLEQRLSKHVITAPFDGQVLVNMVESGSLIRSGMKLGEYLSTNNYELEISLPLSDLKFVNVGTKVDIYSQDLKTNWNGSINRISNFIDPQTQTLKAYVGIGGGNLKDGMYLKATIKGDFIKDVFKLPRKAIINNNYVYIIKNERLEKTKVNIVKVDDEFAYLQNLPTDILVCKETLVNVINGTKVKVIE